MRPLLARSGSRNACVTLKTPLRLIAMMSCQSFSTASASAVKTLRRVDPGVVDEDRDVADLLGDLLGDREAILAIRDVERKALRAAASVADLLRGLRRRRLVDVEQHDARALARKAGGDRAADAGGGARDD